MLVYSTYKTDMLLNWRTVWRATPIVAERSPLTNKSHRLTMSVGMGGCVRGPLFYTLDISAFECAKHSTTIKHISHECVKLIESYYAAFDTKGPSTLVKAVPIIGMEDTVTRSRRIYTQDHLRPSKSSN